MKNKINAKSLVEHGFKVELDNKERKIKVLYLSVKNWTLCCTIINGVVDEFIIEADGGYYCNGSFDISNFKYIEQIDNLVMAMIGDLND